MAEMKRWKEKRKGNAFKASVAVNELKKTDFFPFYTKQALAERWGVSRQVVNDRYKRHDDFPKPVEGLIKGGGPYYPLYEIMRYEALRGLKVNE
jgi:hypothetical protein